MQTLLLTMAAMTPTTSYFANLIVMTLRDGLIVAMGWLYIGFFQPDICGLFEQQGYFVLFSHMTLSFAAKRPAAKLGREKIPQIPRIYAKYRTHDDDDDYYYYYCYFYFFLLLLIIDDDDDDDLYTGCVRSTGLCWVVGSCFIAYQQS